MTYVASPSFTENTSERKANLEQCLRTAKHHLDEVSHASDTEKDAELVASAIAAGWDEAAVRAALSTEPAPSPEARLQDEIPRPVVPSSSM